MIVLGIILGTIYTVGAMRAESTKMWLTGHYNMDYSVWKPLTTAGSQHKKRWATL